MDETRHVDHDKNYIINANPINERAPQAGNYYHLDGETCQVQ